MIFNKEYKTNLSFIQECKKYYDDQISYEIVKFVRNEDRCDDTKNVFL